MSHTEVHVVKGRSSKVARGSDWMHPDASTLDSHPQLSQLERGATPIVLRMGSLHDRLEVCEVCGDCQDSEA
jgi:hypothetical protein